MHLNSNRYVDTTSQFTTDCSSTTELNYNIPTSITTSESTHTSSAIATVTDSQEKLCSHRLRSWNLIKTIVIKTSVPKIANVFPVNAKSSYTVSRSVQRRKLDVSSDEPFVMIG